MNERGETVQGIARDLRRPNQAVHRSASRVGMVGRGPGRRRGLRRVASREEPARGTPRRAALSSRSQLLPYAKGRRRVRRI